MPDRAEPLFNTEDFQSVRMELTATNATTGFAIQAPKKKHPALVDEPMEPQIRLIEFLPDSIVLEVPRGACVRGHGILLHFHLDGPAEQLAPLTGGSGKTASFQATGKVLEIIEEKAGSDSARIKLVQYDETGWQNFQSIFGGRQAAIDEFFQAVRGY